MTVRLLNALPLVPPKVEASRRRGEWYRTDVSLPNQLGVCEAVLVGPAAKHFGEFLVANF